MEKEEGRTFRGWLESSTMYRVEVHLDRFSEDPYETFFVRDWDDIEKRLSGYRSMFEPEVKVLHRAFEEVGEAEAHDEFGY